jgi:4'-phosphopantetheinyl transferase
MASKSGRQRRNHTEHAYRETAAQRTHPSLRTRQDQLAAEILSVDEQATFKRLAPRDRVSGLLNYWTRKEALLKATGDGLRVPMRTITVSGPDEPPLLRRWQGLSAPVASVALRQLHPGTGHVAHLAVLGLPAVRVQQLDAEELLAMGSP